MLPYYGEKCDIIVYIMERKTGAFFLIFVFASLAFWGCFSSWKGDEATITLIFGNTSGSRASGPDEETFSHLVHIIELDGPTGRQSHKAEGNKTLIVTVMPGHWRVSVRALLNSTLYARGEDGANVKAGQNNPIEIQMETLIKDDLIFVTNNLDYNPNLNTPEHPIPGSLRHALNNIPPDKGNITIMVMLPPGSKIELKDYLNFFSDIDLIIEGNGISLSKNTEQWGNDTYNRLMFITTGQSYTPKITIRRVHFRDSEGGAIQNNMNLSLESCIFSNNAAVNSGGAVENAGTLTVKGCTFYNNSANNSSTARGDGGAIHNSYSGQIKELIGNLFFDNKASFWPVIYNENRNNVSSCDYNAVDRQLGTAEDESGWNPGLGDKSFAASVPLVDENFKPAPALNSMVPKNLEGFPTTDFYGNNRTSGAPGAVN